MSQPKQFRPIRLLRPWDQPGYRDQDLAIQSIVDEIRRLESTKVASLADWDVTEDTNGDLIVRSHTGPAVRLRLTAAGALSVSGTASISGATDLRGTLAVSGAATLRGTLAVSGTAIFLVPVVTVTSDYTALDTDTAILADASSNTITVSLPTAVGRSGKLYRVKKIGTGVLAVTIDPSGTETVDGGLTAAITLPNAAVTIVSDGAHWWIF